MPGITKPADIYALRLKLLISKASQNKKKSAKVFLYLAHTKDWIMITGNTLNLDTVFYEVRAGDNLSAIIKNYYGIISPPATR